MNSSTLLCSGWLPSPRLTTELIVTGGQGRGHISEVVFTFGQREAEHMSECRCVG